MPFVFFLFGASILPNFPPTINASMPRFSTVFVVHHLQSTPPPATTNLSYRTPFLTIDDDDDTSHHASKPVCEPSPSIASHSTRSPSTTFSNPNKMAKPSTPRAPSASPDEPSITDDDLASEMKKDLQHLTKGTVNIRKMWMTLPNVPEILRGWIEMTGTSLGVLRDGKIVQ
ncbi:unnamed protein product [Lactuca saligna]|uniref:Uncharacterized protein n=1 Tax=Lactuca saligna TaxID=75948 RepID=A0AA35VFG4_LACSI|nr:unnamed protein product [Lactuca saligna]